MIENREKVTYGSIELIRFVAAILISALHINWWVDLNVNNFLIMHGEKLVPVFCVLAGLLADKTLSNNFNIKYYINSRIIRIMPVYLLSLFVLFLQNAYIGYTSILTDKISYTLQNIFLLRILGGPFLVLPQHWSLAVEMFFYFTIPTLYLYENKYKIILMMIIILSLSDIIGTREFGLYKFLLIGVLTNKLINSIYSNYHKTIIFIIGIVWLSILFTYLLYNPLNQNNIQIGVVISLLLIGSINNENIQINSNKITKYLSNISYSIYTIHVLILIQLFDIRLDGTGNLEITKIQINSYMYILYFSLTIIFSTLVYYCYEKPIINILNKINKA